MMIACIGTENVALVAGLGEASRLALAESGSMLLHLLSLKHRLVSALLQGFAAEVWWLQLVGGNNTVLLL